MNDYRALDIENYLEGDMTEEEKRRFEAELSSNAELRALFETYRTINMEMRNAQKYNEQESALRKTLEGLNKKYFSSETPLQSAAPLVSISRSRNFLKIAVSAAAAVVLFFTAYLLFINNDNAVKLANKYVHEDLSHLSQTMDGARDSLQQGIAAYNNKDYSAAVNLFEAIYKTHPDNSDALRYAGITYLVTKDYSRAIACFDELAAKKDLFSNAGNFLKALTLLQRNEKGDKENAKQLLEKVVKEEQQGSEEAARWLKQW
ncbi:MAG: tetratricopeptide repeat protein [Chitinophagaceae bacterium]|nr:tetratricopeptide repeat protein [Chitinophagaceae bacterium]